MIRRQRLPIAGLAPIRSDNDRGAARDRAPLLSISGLGLVLAIVAVSIAWISDVRRDAERETRKQLAGIAQILAENADRAVHMVDVLLRGLVSQIEAMPESERRNGRALFELWHDHLLPLPQARAMIVLDRDGVAVGDSATPEPRPLDASDREFFRRHRDDASAGLFIGAPIESRLNGHWTITVSRRIADADGAFGGVAVVALDPAYFAQQFAQADQTGDRQFALIGQDRVVRARYPFDAAWMGRAFVLPELADAAERARDGMLTTASHPDGAAAHVGFASARSYPLVVVASRARAAVAADKRGEILLVAAGGTVVAVLVGALFFVLRQQAIAQSLFVADLNRARLAAEQAERAKTRFLASISHELRTPLNSVIGFSELLQHRSAGITDQRHLQYIADIQNAGTHLLDLVQEILDHASLEAGKLRLNIEVVHPAEILRTVMRLLERSAAMSGVRFELELETPMDDVRLRADPRRLQQILLNLVANAIKFSNRGGHVRVAMRRGQDGETLFEIVDTGIGMTAAEIQRAFEPFGRADNEMARKREGSGLGLCNVKSLVDLHGARLEFDSAPGKGTCARVIFASGTLAVVTPQAVAA